MYVAMKDLEIRGAGNLLGGEQSGPHRGRRVRPVRPDGRRGGAPFKGEQPEEAADVKIDLPVDAHLPHDYIAVERLRLEMYRKLAEARTRRGSTSGRRDDRPLRRAAGAGPEPVRDRTVPPGGPFARDHRRLGAGPAPAVLAAAAARLQAAAAQALPPGRGLQGRRPTRSACRARRPAGSAASRCATPSCSPGGPNSSPDSPETRQDRRRFLTLTP